MLGGPTHKLKKLVRLQNAISQFIKKPMTPHDRQWCYLGLVSEHLAMKILTTIGVGVLDFEYQIDRYAIKHVANKHGTRADVFTLVPLILHEPDTVLRSEKTKQGLEALIFEKQVDENMYHCVMELRYGRRVLALKTFYRKRKTPC